MCLGVMVGGAQGCIAWVVLEPSRAGGRPLSGLVGGVPERKWS